MRAAIATGTVAVLVLGACGDAGTDQAAPAVERPEYIASAGASDWYFADLPTMVATADVVVSGTVQSIEQGRETGTEEAGSEAVDSRPKMRLRAVSLKVDDVFKGAVKPGESIVLEEFGYDRSGAPFEIEDLPWSEIGDTGIFFLYHAPDQPDLSYFQVNADGRLLFEGEKVVSFADTPLGEELSRLAAKDARAAVDSAATDAELRNIPPQERFSVQERETIERDENPRERDAAPREPGPPTPEAVTRLGVFDSPALHLHVDNDLTYLYTPSDLALTCWSARLWARYQGSPGCLVTPPQQPHAARGPRPPSSATRRRPKPATTISQSRSVDPG